MNNSGLVLNNYNNALEKNINPILSVNFGLPHELWDDAMQTIEFITKIQAEKNVSICFMTCFPGSKVFSNSDGYKIRKESSPTGLPFRTIYNNYSMQAVFDRLYDCNIIRDNINCRVAEVTGKYTALLTGIYPNVKLEPVFEMIFVDKINSDNLEFIDRYLDLNGTIVFKGANLVMSKQYYCDDRKQLKVQMRDFDTVLEKAYNYDCYIPNQDNIKITDNYIIVQHNDKYIKNFIKVPMKQNKTREDIGIYIREAEEFFKTNIVDLSNFERFNWFNVCRYSGFCSVKQLRVIKILDKKIYTGCMENKIGVIYDDYATLLNNVKKISEVLNLKRKCNTCDVKKWCSQCLFSESIDTPYGDYCDFMLNNQKLLVYLKVIYQLKNYLLNLIKLENDWLNVYLPQRKVYENDHSVIYQISDEICLVQQASVFFVLHLLDSGLRKCSYEEGKAIKELFLSDDEEVIIKNVEDFIPKFIEYGILISL